MVRRSDAPRFETTPEADRTKFKKQHYRGLFSRLVRLTRTVEGQNENGCWQWTAVIRGRYPQFNIKDDEGKQRCVRAHRAILVLLEIGEETEHFWQLYTLYGLAGFEADHMCTHPASSICINPDHLQWQPSRDDHKEVTKARGQSIYRRKE